jgi:hypothetical protein
MLAEGLATIDTVENAGAKPLSLAFARNVV